MAGPVFKNFADQIAHESNLELTRCGIRVLALYRTGNCTIAEFMGGKLNAFEYYDFPETKAPPYPVLETAQLRYHNDWSWIMPVCWEFDHLYRRVKFTKHQHQKYVSLCENIDNAVTNYNLPPVYEALLEAIEWFNKIKKSTT